MTKKLLLCPIFIIMGVILLSGCSNNKMIVKFETNGGTIIENLVWYLNNDEEFSLQLPKNPKKEGFRFASWYLDKELKKNLWHLNHKKALLRYTLNMY